MSQAISLTHLESTSIPSKAFPNLQKVAIATSIIGAVVLGAFLGLGIHEALTHGSMLPIQATMIGVGGGLTIIAGAIAYRFSKTFTPHPAPPPTEAASNPARETSGHGAHTHATAQDLAGAPPALPSPQPTPTFMPAAAAAATARGPEGEAGMSDGSHSRPLAADDQNDMPIDLPAKDDEGAPRTCAQPPARPPGEAAGAVTMTPPPPQAAPSPMPAPAAAAGTDIDLALRRVDPRLLAKATQARDAARAALAERRSVPQGFSSEEYARNHLAIAIEHLIAEINVLEATFQAYLESIDRPETVDRPAKFLYDLRYNNRTETSPIRQAYTLYKETCEHFRRAIERFPIELQHQFTLRLDMDLNAYHALFERTHENEPRAAQRKFRETYCAMLDTGKFLETLQTTVNMLRKKA